MQVVGLSSTSYWCHWILTICVLSTLSTLILQFSCMIAGFELFFKVPFFLMFSLFFLLCLSMSSLGICLSTCVTTQSLAYAISYAIVLFSIILQMAFTNVMVLYYTMYTVPSSLWVIIIRNIFDFYPPFIFSKIFGNLSHTSSRHFNDLKFTWVDAIDY